MPTDQMSARWSVFFTFWICSGDMYVGEPMMARLAVTLVGSEPPVPKASSTLEIPKSSTLMTGGAPVCCVRNRLEGLRSRWTTPRAWASATASSACTTYSTASPTGSGPRRS